MNILCFLFHTNAVTVEQASCLFYLKKKQAGNRLYCLFYLKNKQRGKPVLPEKETGFP